MLVLLVAGLVAIFSSILLALAAGGVLGERAHPGVQRSLAAVEAVRPAATRAEHREDLREQELTEPFVDRVLDPLLRHFVGIGRRLTPDQRMQGVRHRLDLAGNPAGWGPDRVVASKALCSLVGFMLGLTLPPALGAGVLPTLGFAVLGLLTGWYIPSLWLYQVSYDRSERIRRDLPDALDLMTISVEAGLAFDAALSQVARRTRGPLAREFFRVLQEIQIGTGRADAMRALSQRTDVAELRSFVGAMVQADDLGVPVSKALRVQADEMRVKRSQRAQEVAQKVPVKILFPLIFCIMPSLFVVVLGPAAITLIQNFAGRGL